MVFSVFDCSLIRSRFTRQMSLLKRKPITNSLFTLLQLSVTDWTDGRTDTGTWQRRVWVVRVIRSHIVTLVDLSRRSRKEAARHETNCIPAVAECCWCICETWSLRVMALPRCRYPSRACQPTVRAFLKKCETHLFLQSANLATSNLVYNLG